MEIDWNHNHEVQNAYSLNFRPLGADETAKAQNHFKNGLSPTQTLNQMFKDLYQSTDSNKFTKLMDGKHMPTYETIQRLVLMESVNYYNCYVYHVYVFTVII